MNIRGDGKAQHRVMKLALGAIAFWSVHGSPTAVAAEPLALRKIMSELGANMQRVTDGLSREDYALVEKTARAIADHPQPPVSEKTRIIGFVGGNITRFKGYDAATHDAAMALAAMAKQRDAQGALHTFHRLQSSCLACHQEFRKPFVEHFYGTRAD